MFDTNIFGMPYDRAICIIKNGHRISKKKMTNASLVKNLFGVGQGTAYNICYKLQINPEAKEGES